ncbi:MAG: alpha/beta hydrolase [Defluviitaleaceae bacterium]|nr:alpha/beta hydrolase [Defluviitaleaceae bacterium]
MECNVNGTRLFYKECGVGTPILCLHGHGIDHRTMAGCLEPIFANLPGYRRIYVDLPGRGNSPPAPGIQNADDMLVMLEGFISQVIGGEEFLLVGESYGGYLSLGLIRARQRVMGLFLLCPCTIADAKRRQLPSEAEMAVIITETKEIQERFDNEIKPGLIAADKAYITKYQKEGYSFSFASKIGEIVFNKPTCVVLGRQDDTVGYADTLNLMQNFTMATYVIADGASHNMQIERVDLFNASVLDWLDRLSMKG